MLSPDDPLASLPLDRRRALSLLGMGAAAAAAATIPAVAGMADDVSWLAETQRPAASTAPARALPPLLVDRSGRAITALDGWQKQREELRQQWLKRLGPLATARRPTPALTVLGEDRPPGVIRQHIRYEVEPGLFGEAYLLRPAEAAGRRPGVAVFHSTTDVTIRQPAGIEGQPEKAFGLALARRGCVCFCPRNFLWPGEGKLDREQVTRLAERHPGSKGMAKMLYDAQAAVDVLAAQADVDVARIGAVGHSLGAKQVLYLAAFDERVKAAVSSEGGVGLAMSNWDAPWYLGPDARTAFPEHHELLALAAPRAFLLVGGDSADGAPSWPFVEAALPVYRLYGERPRLGLFNHRQGHAVPPEARQRIEEWLVAYLSPDREKGAAMQRYGMVIGLAEEKIDEYRRLHAAVWPGVLKKIAECNIRNYSIFLRKLEDGRHYLFGYFEYHGRDFAADMAAMAADETTRRWWTFCEPCQRPLSDRQPGQWWATMEEVFHVD